MRSALWFYGRIVLLFLLVCSVSRPVQARVVTAGGRGALAWYGDVAQVLMPLGVLATTALVKDREGMKQFGASYVSTAVAVEVLKRTVRERRPNGLGRQSFPSGHAASAFSSSWFVWNRYGWKAGLATVPFAALVGYSRIDARRHYLHDVVASAILSGVVSHIFTDRFQATCEIGPHVKSVRMSYRLSF